MEDRVELIRANMAKAQAQIEAACSRVNRPVNGVRLVVVTKSQPIETVRAAVRAGATLLGENYPEESLAKIEDLRGEAVEWHMIGHLQSRKAKIVTDHFAMLQSLDSLSLAEKLERRLAETGKKLPVLLEVNVSGEESKFGLPCWDADNQAVFFLTVEDILRLPHLEMRGLMTMPPLDEDPEHVRPFFRRVKQLQMKLQDRYPQCRWDELSMGTSTDYAVAVEEGATLVRLGTAIVGPRIYKTP